ncbi:putative tRNA (5-methylaminomethyl-2-thiouridylate)-methyltransferase [Halobacteriovorax marinus SJ]|uniref:tRNA (5-methylaminomethyl-2-thiouridylate)-methyltransferase n=2 Tax=Halobacteriovorax marinus TaxID=97084 RepID=E1X2G6_HALMS|nr:putative tRNA (5-methylaminomethyl-2-thiouridylate)-methyltransferase [Halobacteriovorax marinus SJ]
MKMLQGNQAKQQTILVGMDGGVESTVAAYLLKKQGLNVVGLGVVFHEYSYKSLSVWTPKSLENIKKICNQLEIPFYGTNINSLFYSRVLEPVVSTRLAAEQFEPVIAWNKILIETLIEKAKVVGATGIATGHKAKVFKNQKSGVYSLLVPADVANDETYGLSRLSQDELSKLIFPLAEIKQNEILKIANLLGITFAKDDIENKKRRKKSLFRTDFIEVVERFSAPTLRKEGRILSYRDGTTICEHDGVHLYHLNQEGIVGKKGFAVDKTLSVIRINPRQQDVIVDNIERYHYTHCRLMRFSHDPAMDLSKPLQCFVQTKSSGAKLPCKLYFKNNRAVVVEFEDEQEGVCPRGGYLVFYNRRAIGATVIGSGVVRSSGYFDDEEYRTYPKTRAEDDEFDEDEPKKKKIHLEF